MFTTFFALLGSSKQYKLIDTNSQRQNLRSSQQFVHQDPERPEVHGPVVALVEDDLGGDVLRGPAECPGLTAAVDVLGKSEVDHLNVSLFIYNTLTG